MKEPTPYSSCQACSSGAGGNIDGARHRRPGEEALERAIHMRVLLESHELSGVIKTDEVADPREHRHVGDGVRLAHQPATTVELVIEDLKHAARLADVAIARPLVLEVLAGELVEEADLSKHRSHSAHLEHEPLNRLAARARILRQKPAGFFREVEEDRAGLKQRQWPCARAPWVDDRGNLAVGIQRAKLRRSLVVGVEVNEMRLIGEAGFLEHE